MLMKAISTPILFGLYTLMSVSGMVLVKYAAPLLKSAIAEGHNWKVPAALALMGAGLYAASFLTWMVILVRSSLIIAYPIAVGLTMAFSTICAIFILGEKMTLASGLGVALVFVGVFLLTRA